MSGSLRRIFLRIIVQKFGGSSVADAERVRRVARRIIQTRNEGYSPVVVVSAQGKTTDQLLAKAYEITPNPSGRELDMLLATGEQASMALLALAIQAEGVPAISMTGGQSGIHTDSHHNKAKILSVQPDRIIQALEQGNIVIVAGFQGISEQQEITTLGRGGSDTTAVALAASLKAEACEIYTDVDGVYSADPRLVPNAFQLKEVIYEEMLEMASLGARVLHLRSVEIAKNYGVPLHVRSSFHNRPGTWVKEVVSMEQAPVVTGVAHDYNVAKLTILNVPDKPGVAARLFTGLAEHGFNVDMIVQSASRDGWNDISFTVERSELAAVTRVANRLCEEIGADSVVTDDKVAKVSIVGAGMISHHGVAASFFRIIADLGHNIEMISTSDISISCVVAEHAVEEIVQATHRHFLEQ